MSCYCRLLGLYIFVEGFLLGVIKVVIIRSLVGVVGEITLLFGKFVVAYDDSNNDRDI